MSIIQRYKKSQIELELKKLEFEKSLEQRKFEIGNFWTRAWFFGALFVSIIGIYITLLKDNNTHYCIYLSFLGLIISFAQCLMNRGSKYWQERWEYHTKNKEHNLGIDVTLTNIPFKNFSDEEYNETDLIEAYILAKDENCLTRSKRYSVSKITMLVWDILALFCLGLWIKDANILHHYYSGKQGIYVNRTFAIWFHAIICAYIFFFLFLRKRKDGSAWWKVLKFCDGGGGKVYSKLGKNLIPIPQQESCSKNEGVISREELEKIYYAGKIVRRSK